MARTRRGHASSRVSTKRAVASIGCSQLSITTNCSLWRMESTRTSVIWRPGISGIPMASASALGTSSPSESGASSTSHTPSGKAPTRSRPPPGPALSCPSLPRPLASTASSWQGALYLDHLCSVPRSCSSVLAGCLCPSSRVLSRIPHSLVPSTGKRPEAISSLKARLEAFGSTPSSLVSASSRRS